MDHVEPLPALLADRYRAWRAELFDTGRQALADLAVRQAPEVMIVACCDSRVMVSKMFSADAGDYFVHRNIAALVPPHDAPGGTHATLSTVEFAVSSLSVRHILVVGHTGCGGVAGAHDLCTGAVPPHRHGRFVAPWLATLRPVYDATRGAGSRTARIAAMERETIRFSLRNLATLPFVREAAEAGALSLHGALWCIADQRLEVCEPGSGAFAPLPD